MGAFAHPAAYRLPSHALVERLNTPVSGSDQLKFPVVSTTSADASVGAPAQAAEHPPSPARAVPMLWRVFAANAAVFALAFALLALTPFEIHARIRLIELVILLAGLIVMLLVDLALLRHALTPLARLAKVMDTINLRRPGQRAVGFERSSSEVLALARAFNEMLERLEQERRESSARVLAAQEGERLRIARELHDEIGQTLTAVALRAEHQAAQMGDEHPEFSELAEIVQHSLADVRRISLELRPGALEQLGLTNALISLCARVAEQSGIRVHRNFDGSIPPTPPEIELALYRIAQEALTNVMRHSRASEVTVSLRAADAELVLSIADNGRGLPAELIEGGGLTGMRERALLIGAELRIEPTPPGVTVTLR
ncbi:MAG TPA: sensor histidine kinase, partial [Dehalococcoidia bacterium]|nr:sensor histidine kinase [Dehalococcoidia bacterium]